MDIHMYNVQCTIHSVSVMLVPRHFFQLSQHTARLNYKHSLLLLIRYKFNRRYCHYYLNYYKIKTQTYQLHVSRIYLKWQRSLQSYVLKETPYTMPYIISLRITSVEPTGSIMRPLSGCTAFFSGTTIIWY